MNTEQMECVKGSAEVMHEAKALMVKTVSARQRATDLFDAIRAFRKQSEAQKEEICRPLKDEWEKTKKPFDDFKKECEGHEVALQQKMGEWDREQKRLADEAQAKMNAKIEAENAVRIAKAEAKGYEPVLKVAPVVPAPPKTVTTQAGTTQTRTVKKTYTPTNLASLMRDFPHLFDLNMVKFNAMAKAGAFEGRADVMVGETYVYSQHS